MYFSRVHIRPEHLTPEKLAHLLSGDLYFFHQMFWQMFPHEPDAKRDFIYRRDDKNNWPRFYVVSRRKPQEVSGLFSIVTKAYRPKLNTGQRLAFSLRVNPVVTRKNETGGKRRHDVVMDTKKNLKNINADIFPPEIIRSAGIQWLSTRSEKCGFEFDPLMVHVEGYLQHRFMKSNGVKTICFSTLDYHGLLTVTESERFVKSLYHGIGPAKAFGCGLLLAKRA